MRLQPAANKPPGVIERARRVLVAAPVQHSQVGRESDQEPQLLDPQISSAQRAHAIAGVSGLDKRVKHVEGGDLDAVAEREFVTSRKLLDGGEKPDQELTMRLE